MGKSEGQIHHTAEIDGGAHIGDGTIIWQYAHVRSGATIGADCIIGRGAYIDPNVEIGDRCKIQNYACLYGPARLGNGVFIGPHAVLTNDRYPRSTNPDRTLKQAGDWDRARITIEDGASIGAGAIVLPGVTVGLGAMVGAGSVVVEDAPAWSIAVGAPAHVIGMFCDRCGERMTYVVEGCLAHYECRGCGSVSGIMQTCGECSCRGAS